MKYVWIVSIVGAAALVVMMVVLYPKSLWQRHRQMVARYMFQSDYIETRDQPFRNPIVIDSIKLSQPGYIRLQMADAFGEIGEDMAQSYGVLPAGEYKNITIELNQDPVYDPNDLTDAPVRTVWAVLQYNTGRKPGDREVSTDTHLHGNRYYPATNALGDVIAVKFTVRY